MTSAVELCNYALAHAKAEALIETLDTSADSSEEVRYCALYYDDLRKRLLRDHDWGFAKRYQYLSDTGGTPLDTRWTYMYQYPSGIVAFRKVVNLLDPNKKIRHEIANDPTYERVILTNQEQAIGKVTLDIEDVSLFDPTFYQALTWLLAQHLAGPLGSGEGRAAYCGEQYNRLAAGASAHDAAEGQDQTIHDAPWIEARR